MGRAQLERYTCDRCGLIAEVDLGQLQPMGWRMWTRRYLTVPPNQLAVAVGEFVLCSECDDHMEAAVKL